MLFSKPPMLTMPLKHLKGNRKRNGNSSIVAKLVGMVTTASKTLDKACLSFLVMLAKKMWDKAKSANFLERIMLHIFFKTSLLKSFSLCAFKAEHMLLFNAFSLVRAATMLLQSAVVNCSHRTFVSLSRRSNTQRGFPWSPWPAAGKTDQRWHWARGSQLSHTWSHTHAHTHTHTHTQARMSMPQQHTACCEIE